MAGTTSVDPRTTNAILRSLEGDEIWSELNLTYAFATAADASRTQDEFDDRGATGTLNYLDTTDPDDLRQRQAVVESFDAFERVTNLNFTATTDFDASDFNIVGVDNFSNAGESTFPGTNLLPLSLFDYESWNFFNTTSFWTMTSTFPRETGGTDFMVHVTIHEFGHALGLAHPHDDGHGSTSISQNLSPNRSTTDNPLDNERYTVMSYERGGTNANAGNPFGHAGTPMALDIAVLQSFYGVNTTTHTGNTTYNLTDRGTTAYDPDGNDGSVTIGRAFYAIWDAGGSDDKIEYNGSNRTLINLNDATLNQTADPEIETLLTLVKQSQVYSDLPGDFKLDYEGDANYGASSYYAGGFFSRVFENSGQFDAGGYAIASGVVIENAEGGNKGDLLIGNRVDNELIGNGGNDALFGFDGNDSLVGGDGDDELTGGKGNDDLEGGAGTDIAFFTEACRNYEITRDDSTGEIVIRHVDGSMVDGTDTLIGIETARFSDADVDLTAEDIDACPPLDFIFLVDLSGSFSDDLPNFVRSAKQIAADLRDENPDVQFAISSFIDLPVSPYGNPGDYLYRADLALTNDVTAFESTLDGLTTGRGGDRPEAQWVGLWRAANGVGLNLRDGSSRIIYMATDAPAHDASDYGLSEANILNFLETGEIDVVVDGAEPATPAAEPAGPVIEGIEDPEPEPDPTGEGAGILPDPSTRPGSDPLIDAIGDALRGLGATPIIGTSGSVTDYSEALDDVGGGGVVITTSSSSSDVADAVRAGLAEISGEVTDTGTAGPDSLTGTEGEDVILGLGGDDTIDGLGSADALDGGSGNDTITGGAGNDDIDGGTGRDVIDAGAGNDDISPGADVDEITTGDGNDLISGPGSSLNGDVITDLSDRDAIFIRTEMFNGTPTLTYDSFSDQTRLAADLEGEDGFDDFNLFFSGDVSDRGIEIIQQGEDIGIGITNFTGTGGNDDLTGNALNNVINGLGGDDTLRGDDGDDVLNAGDGTDTINGGTGNDTISGGETAADRRDTIFAGAGDDSVDGGHGNDQIFGEAGNDRLAGGFGVDEIEGQEGDDVITGSAFSDLVFGGAGNDFVNGGFGFDRINGGTGADKFFHVGVEGHGSDWIQDYLAPAGDVLFFGNARATASNFQVNFTHTTSPEGERAGDDDVEEAFVIYKPTGQIMWALVDGGGQEEINLMISGNAEVFDLLA